MSSRTILSRPRTRIYDANYNIGQNYYKPALDGLDRKYSPRPVSPLRPSIAQDILNRHEEAFLDDDLNSVRRRAEKRITERNVFDSRGGRIAQRALDLFENDVGEEALRTNKRVSINDALDVGDAVDISSQLSSQRLRSENASRTSGLEENVRIRKRALKVNYDEKDAGSLVKWSPLQRTEEKEGAAALRAKQSRERLVDLEEEMNAIAEKQAARERRAARFKALVAESTEETEAAQSALQSVSLRSRREQRTFDE